MQERAIHIVSCDVRVDGGLIPAQRMRVLSTGGAAQIVAEGAARVLLCGGASLDGERFQWWNFVVSSKQRIERAKVDWLAQAFGHVRDETEFIPTL